MNENVVLVECSALDPNGIHSKKHSFFVSEGKNTKTSSSGLILNSEEGIILVSGNLFSSFLKNNELPDDIVFTIHTFNEENEKKAKLIKILHSSSVDKWISQICSGSSDWFW
jgi:hypothetical protein